MTISMIKTFLAKFRSLRFSRLNFRG